MDIREIVDLDRYFLDRLSGPEGSQFLSHCRSQLAETGSCLLPGFLRPEALAAALSDADAALSRAHQVDHAFAYDYDYPNPGAVPLASLPPDHPRHFSSLTRIRFIAKDLIPDGDPLKRLFHWPPMADFVGAALGMPAAYPSACPLSGCVFTVAEAGELQDWHFDSNEFIVTLVLRDSPSGGSFEYVPSLRAPGRDDDFDGVGRALAGDRRNVIRLKSEPGTLTLFKGRYNFHRASPVAGAGRRVMAILSYEDGPDRVGVDSHLKLFYGRTLADVAG